MKYIQITLFCSIALLLFGTSCKSRKNPSLSANTLITQIQEQEDQNALDEQEAQKMRDSLARLPKGFQYKEVRSIDARNPPVVFHFTDSMPQREYRLSEIATQLEYIVVKTSQIPSLDLSFFSVAMGNEVIVLYGIQGIELFDIQGNYIRTIVKNTGQNISNGIGRYSPQNLVGFPFMKISVADNTFLYVFLDGPANNVSVMKVDPARFGNEINIQVEVPGLNLNQGTGLKQIDGLEFLSKLACYDLGDGLWASLENKWNSGSKGDLLTVYGPAGDTLCQFKDYDRIVNYPGGPYRNTDHEVSYYFKKTLSYKPAHNDTLFRVIPPNRLLPAYVFDFGHRKVGLMEGLISGNDLSEKNLSRELFETNRYLFYMYTRNQVVGKALRTGNYRYFYSLIDKKSNQIYHLSNIKTADGGILNDLDGGLPFWPDGVNEEGIPFMWCSGLEFKKQSVSKRINGLVDTDAVIILAK